MLSGLLPDFVLPRIFLKMCNYRHSFYIFWWKISFLNEGEIGNKWRGGHKTVEKINLGALLSFFSRKYSQCFLLFYFIKSKFRGNTLTPSSFPLLPIQTGPHRLASSCPVKELWAPFATHGPVAPIQAVPPGVRRACINSTPVCSSLRQILE